MFSRTTVCALLTVFSLIPAVSFKAVAAERLEMTAPQGWHLEKEVATDYYRTWTYMPDGQTGKDWKLRLTVDLFHGMRMPSRKQYYDGVYDLLAGKCEKVLNDAAIDPNEMPLPVMAFNMACIGPKKRSEFKEDEITHYYAIAGLSNFIVLKMTSKETAKDKDSMAARMAELWTPFNGGYSLCDTDTWEHACGQSGQLNHDEVERLLASMPELVPTRFGCRYLLTVDILPEGGAYGKSSGLVPLVVGSGFGEADGNGFAETLAAGLDAGKATTVVMSADAGMEGDIDAVYGKTVQAAQSIARRLVALGVAPDRFAARRNPSCKAGDQG